MIVMLPVMRAMMMMIVAVMAMMSGNIDDEW